MADCSNSRLLADAARRRGDWRENLRLTLANPALWLLALSLGLLNAVRYGFLDWGLTHLKEVQGGRVDLNAVKIAVLCAVSWTVLAAVLTTMGVVEAEHGLHEQAQLALASDGQQVATSIDDWHELHQKAVLGLARMPGIQKVMADPAQPDVVVQAVNDNLRTAMDTYSDTGSFGLMGLDGLFRYSSDEGDFDNTTGGQRDFFRDSPVGQ